jgi:hypothetical protein
VLPLFSLHRGPKERAGCPADMCQLPELRIKDACTETLATRAACDTVDWTRSLRPSDVGSKLETLNGWWLLGWLVMGVKLGGARGKIGHAYARICASRDQSAHGTAHSLRLPALLELRLERHSGEQ